MNNSFTVMTYNTHEAVGSDKKRNYQRIVDVIRSVDPAVVALQEVDVRPDNDTAQESLLFETIRNALDFYGVKGITMVRSQSGYGNVIFLKSGPQNIMRHDISFKGCEPRGILECVTEINNRPLRIINTHLGLKRKERMQQTDALIELLNKEKETPTILAGDFNEWLPRSRVIRRLGQQIRKVSAGRTFPARLPVFTLDHIFYNDALKLIKSGVVNTALSRKASDHRPLVARFSQT